MRWKNGLALSITAVFALALFFAACDLEEAAKDEASKNADTSVDEEEEIELEAIVVDMEGETVEKAVGDLTRKCGQTSVNQALDDAGVDTDDIDINSLEVIKVEVRYRNAFWTGGDDVITCRLYMFDPGDEAGQENMTDLSVSRLEEDIEYEEHEVPQSTIDFMNGKMANRDEEFVYCAEDELISDDFRVEFEIRLTVRLQGEVDI
ncbi:MAG: hypothetical protein M5R36_05740 [Deltaproteobacteria bacterium]|nr:hypothetical protein [Deltaproteobacteria bacterium]